MWKRITYTQGGYLVDNGLSILARSKTRAKTSNTRLLNSIKPKKSARQRAEQKKRIAKKFLIKRGLKPVRIVGKDKNTRYLGESTFLGDKVYIYQTNTRADAKEKRRALKAGRIIKANIVKNKAKSAYKKTQKARAKDMSISEVVKREMRALGIG